MSTILVGVCCTKMRCTLVPSPPCVSTCSRTNTCLRSCIHHPPACYPASALMSQIINSLKPFCQRNVLHNCIVLVIVFFSLRKTCGRQEVPSTFCKIDKWMGESSFTGFDVHENWSVSGVPGSGFWSWSRRSTHGYVRGKYEVNRKARQR